MYHDCFSNFARRNCAFFSDAVPVHRVVRAAEFKMATGCKFLSLAASNEGKNLTESSPSPRNLTSPEYSKLTHEQCKVSTSSNTYLHEFFFLFKHV